LNPGVGESHDYASRRIRWATRGDEAVGDEALTASLDDADGTHVRQEEHP
jgi:hypothetical protein